MSVCMASRVASGDVVECVGAVHQQDALCQQQATARDWKKREREALIERRCGRRGRRTRGLGRDAPPLEFVIHDP
jgi:hypothetical protein